MPKPGGLSRLGPARTLKETSEPREAGGSAAWGRGYAHPKKKDMAKGIRQSVRPMGPQQPIGGSQERRFGGKAGAAVGKVDSLTSLHLSHTTKVSGSRQGSFSHCRLSEGGRDVSMFNVDVKVSEEMKKTEDSGQWQPDLWANPWARSDPGWWGLLTSHS